MNIVHPRTRTRWGGLAMALAVLIAAASGCTRAYYRQQADNEVYRLLENGQRDPRWDLGRYTIDIDPRSRFYDPTCPDHSPMPPDDPTAHQLMHCVDCKNGWPCWHRNGDTPYVANPAFGGYLPYDADGNLILDRNAAIQIALVNSNAYQNNLEQLYLSALDVTFERFRFDTQFFAGNDTFFTSTGRAIAGRGGQSSSTLSTATDLQAQRLFAGGGELVAGVANSFVWQFAGPDMESANTLLDFTFIQPLLRFAGRERVLERLTVSERILLGNIRAMQRYRKGFYIDIVTGQNAPSGPQRRGGFLGGAGLSGFSGVGAGGFGRAGGGGGGGGGGATAGAGAAQVGGYLGLLQDARQIANLRSNVEGLRRSLELLEALYQANRIDRLQVDQARQSLFNQQSSLINAEAAYQSSLDAFKLTLGLPQDMTIKVEDPLLDRFELLGPDMVALQNQASNMLAKMSAPVKENAAQNPLVAAEERLQADIDFARQVADMLRLIQSLVPAGDNQFQVLRQRVRVFDGRLEQMQAIGFDLRRALEQLRSYPEAIRKAIELQTAAKGKLPQVEAAMDNLNSKRDDRIRSLRNLAEREEVKSGKVDVRAFDIEAFKARLEQLPKDYAEVSERLNLPADHWQRRLNELQEQRDTALQLVEQFSQLLAPLRPSYEQLKAHLDMPGQLELPQAAIDFANELARLTDDPHRAVEQFLTNFRQLEQVLSNVFVDINALSQDASALGLIQARARLEATDLLPIDLEPARAFAIAQQNRLDLMNARATLVDAWRLIEFNADGLQSDLSIEFSGDLSTLDDNPFRFRNTAGRLRAGIRFDAPITRLGERNTYRQSLIEYQQARRGFINYNDQIYRGLRNILRTIELHQLNFELRRAAVQVSIEQVELAALRLQEPPRPGVVAEGLGATTARDLVSALNDLLTVQNNYLDVWVNYEQQRMQLDLDLGTMMLDERGMWVDPGEIDESKYHTYLDMMDEHDEAPVPPELLPHMPPSVEQLGQLNEESVDGEAAFDAAQYEASTTAEVTTKGNSSRTVGQHSIRLRMPSVEAEQQTAEQQTGKIGDVSSGDAPEDNNSEHGSDGVEKLEEGTPEESSEPLRLLPEPSEGAGPMPKFEATPLEATSQATSQSQKSGRQWKAVRTK